MAESARHPLAYAWASPLTLPGLVLAGAARATGGAVVLRDGVVEAHGGLLAPLLPRLGVGVRPIAMAVGHVVLAVDQGALDRTRRHERVHVDQAERWGPLFPLAYAGASLAALLRGQDPYHDNAFEREACAASEG
ncbi:MAG: hypothetical protein AB7N73_06360 [Gemmatimonadales bacterium]